MKFRTYMPRAVVLAKPMVRELQVKHAVLGMITELGELADNVKGNFVKGKALDFVNGKEEIGDILWYLVLFCDTQFIAPGLLDEIVDKELATLKKVADASPTALVDTMLLLVSMVGLLGLPEKERGSSDAVCVAQLMRFLGIAAAEFNTSISECLQLNITKLEARYSSGGFTESESLNRDVAAERKILENGSH